MNLLRIVCMVQLAAIPWCGSAPDAGLVGYWKLNGDADDYSGKGYHAAITAWTSRQELSTGGGTTSRCQTRHR